MDLKKFDQPIVFAVAIILVVAGGFGLLGPVFQKLGWSGPLGVVKGGVM
jgi:hypothetical protein